jgi:hypothetical protein
VFLYLHVNLLFQSSVCFDVIACQWLQGKETSEPDNGKQCPFFEELDVIFKERAKSMDRMLHEVEAGARPGKAEDQKRDRESQLKSFGQIACRKF